MIFIGDVHGKWDEYRAIIEGTDQPSIQVGDFGLGFPGGGSPEGMSALDWFIRGNHDNPETCKGHPNYLRDFGYDRGWDLFWAGGAWSIDRRYRMAGIDWWFDEELSDRQGLEAIELYQETKPTIMVTHQAPMSIQRKLFDFPFHHPNRTGIILDTMLRIHKPKLWVFGHYHKSRDHIIDGVRYKALNELEVFEYEV